MAMRTLAFISIGLWLVLHSDATSAQQPSAKAIYDCSWFAVATLTKCPPADWAAGSARSNSGRARTLEPQRMLAAVSTARQGHAAP
jgi:hypothetical protein